MWPYGQAVKTSPSQGEITSSILVKATIKILPNGRIFLIVVFIMESLSGWNFSFYSQRHKGQNEYLKDFQH